MALQSADVPWGELRPTRFQRLVIDAIHARIFRGATRHLARKVMDAFSPGYDIEVGGVRLRCRLGDNVTERGIIEHGAIPDWLNLSRIIEPLRPGDTVVDIGANCGVYTAFCAKAVGTTGRIVAIEPQPEMLARLRFNVAANSLDNVSVFANAIGETAGTLSMRAKARNLGETKIAETHDGALQVPAMPLADVVRATGIDHIDLLKIDVEGYEDRALLPYMEAMPRTLWPRRIFIEISARGAWRTDCVEELVRAGYVEEWTDGQDSMLRLAES